jgi:hypothetical protein
MHESFAMLARKFCGGYVLGFVEVPAIGTMDYGHKEKKSQVKRTLSSQWIEVHSPLENNFYLFMIIG